MKKKMKMESSSSDKRELWILILYAVAFYSFVIQRSLRLSTGTLPILNLSFLISLFLSSFFKLNYRLSLPTLRLTLRLALQIHSSLQCINSLFFSFFLFFNSFKFLIFMYMFRMCQMRNGGTFERIYRYLQSFLRFSVWPPMHSEPVFDSKPEECLSFGFSFLSFTLLICTELGMPACLPAFSPLFFNSVSLCLCVFIVLSFFWQPCVHLSNRFA